MSEKTKEIADWTHIQLALDGKCEPHGCYCSYGPEGLTVISPEMGPVTIPPSRKATARFSELVYGAELEEEYEMSMIRWIT